MFDIRDPEFMDCVTHGVAVPRDLEQELYNKVVDPLFAEFRHKVQLSMCRLYWRDSDTER